MIKTLEDLRKLQDRILHIVIDEVYPYIPGESKAEFRIIETGDQLSFKVDTEEDL